MEVFNIKDKQSYLREVFSLTQQEWGEYRDMAEFEEKVNRKIERALSLFEEQNFCIFILLDEEELIGFISITPTGAEEKSELSPWYSTMYVKKEYRGNGYSKKLNAVILKEAKERGFERIFLKSYLVNYYEKFGARYIEKLSNGESLYCIDL